ncbi:hypothetical protein [Streptomyces sp. NPDC056255]|uniref:hypothetical protein n=1 Tax=Streptomyces sp. NPDC056255 TaxID=3345764 RepID=UPI0035E221BE
MATDPRTAKKGSSRPVRLSADRLRKGRPGPAGTRVRLATATDTGAVDMLLDTAGARLIPALRSSIEQGTAGDALLSGLDGTSKTFVENFARRTVGHLMADSMAGVSLTLVATDGQDRPIGALSVTAPGSGLFWFEPLHVSAQLFRYFTRGSRAGSRSRLSCLWWRGLCHPD